MRQHVEQRLQEMSALMLWAENRRAAEEAIAECVARCREAGVGEKAIAFILGTHRNVIAARYGRRRQSLNESETDRVHVY